MINVRNIGWKFGFFSILTCFFVLCGLYFVQATYSASEPQKIIKEHVISYAIPREFGALKAVETVLGGKQMWFEDNQGTIRSMHYAATGPEQRGANEEGHVIVWKRK